MVHSEHCHYHSDELVGSMYTQDEVVWMGIHILGKVLDKLTDDLNMIVDQPELKYD